MFRSDSSISVEENPRLSNTSPILSNPLGVTASFPLLSPPAGPCADVFGGIVKVIKGRNKSKKINKLMDDYMNEYTPNPQSTKFDKPKTMSKEYKWLQFWVGLGTICTGLVVIALLLWIIL